MTYQELRAKFIRDYAEQNKNHPLELEVDAETYGNVCQAIFEHLVAEQQESIILNYGKTGYKFIEVSLGPNCGILFKGTELRIKNAKGK